MLYGLAAIQVRVVLGTSLQDQGNNDNNSNQPSYIAQLKQQKIKENNEIKVIESHTQQDETVVAKLHYTTDKDWHNSYSTGSKSYIFLYTTYCVLAIVSGISELAARGSSLMFVMENLNDAMMNENVVR